MFEKISGDKFSYEHGPGVKEIASPISLSFQMEKLYYDNIPFAIFHTEKTKELGKKILCNCRNFFFSNLGCNCKIVKTSVVEGWIL